MPAAGSLRPRERCTTDMESSTVTNCSPVACTSRSVRPSAGRISAVLPVTTCERLSLVDTCTVSAQERSARSVAAVSGVAEAKLPPIATSARTRPPAIARRVSTVSRPSSRGTSTPNSVANASRNTAGIFSQIPMVRSPCTLECPRTGHRPAPRLPIIPRSSATLAISRMVGTACRCWVRPIAQQKIVRSDSTSSCPIFSIWARASPEPDSMSAQSRPRTCAA